MDTDGNAWKNMAAIKGFNLTPMQKYYPIMQEYVFRGSLVLLFSTAILWTIYGHVEEADGTGRTLHNLSIVPVVLLFVGIIPTLSHHKRRKFLAMTVGPDYLKWRLRWQQRYLLIALGSVSIIPMIYVLVEPESYAITNLGIMAAGSIRRAVEFRDRSSPSEKGKCMIATFLNYFSKKTSSFFSTKA